MESVICLHQIGVVRDDVSVLRGLNLVLPAGEKLAITGPNGSGKTTLLRTIVGLERANAGDIVLFGQPCKSEADFRSQRVKIGFLFQESEDQLFCPTVVEDVAFGPLNIGVSCEKAREQANRVLYALGIEHLAPRFTHRLSGGEKRLVCLAGILAMEPEILLLDEPTNGVDTENYQRLLAALHDFHGGMIIVSHDERLVDEISTCQMRMVAGRLL